MAASAIRSTKYTHTILATKAQAAVKLGDIVTYRGSHHGAQERPAAEYVVIGVDARSLLTIRDRDYPQFFLRDVRRTSIKPTKKRARQCSCGGWCEHEHTETSMCQMHGCSHEIVTDEQAADLELPGFDLIGEL